MYGCVFVPGLRGDLPGDVASAARRLEASSPVLSHDATNDREREAHHDPGAQQQEHRGGWQSLSGAPPPVDGVHHAPRQEQRSFGDKGMNEYIIKGGGSNCFRYLSEQSTPRYYICSKGTMKSLGKIISVYLLNVASKS